MRRAIATLALFACGPTTAPAPDDGNGESSQTGPPAPDDGGELPPCERCVFGHDTADAEGGGCICDTLGCFELVQCTDACWSEDEACLADCCDDAPAESQDRHDIVRACQESDACADACPDGVGRRCPG
jgi:hypothetical protein